jgi:hypothetical protein
VSDEELLGIGAFAMLGGSNVYAPRDIQGMPRTAQIQDHQIGLYQA